MNLRISIADTATPRLRSLMGALQGAGRRDLHAAMGVEVQNLTYQHVSTLAGSRHDTANRLGAAPSNHLAQAAEKIAAPTALSADSNAATLTINHVGMIRALRDVTIVPREAKALAIPVNAIAYNRRPAQIWAELNLFIPKGKNVIAMSDGKKITVLYVLVRSVTQKQDRTLLPSDNEFSAAAAVGAKTFISDSLKKGGNL